MSTAPSIVDKPPLKKPADMSDDELTKAINGKLAVMFQSFKVTVTAAMEVGDLLIEAKGRVGHGHFEAWLGDHCQLPYRTARRYMAMAKNRAQIEAKINAKSAKLADLNAQGLLTDQSSGGGSGNNRSDAYDSVEKKLIERLKKLGTPEAEAAATETIRQITEVVATKTGSRWRPKAA